MAEEPELKEEKTSSHLPTNTWDKFHTRPGDSGMHKGKVTAKTGKVANQNTSSNEGKRVR
jgi:hypothetical protein